MGSSVASDIVSWEAILAKHQLYLLIHYPEFCGGNSMTKFKQMTYGLMKRCRLTWVRLQVFKHDVDCGMEMDRLVRKGVERNGWRRFIWISAFLSRSDIFQSCLEICCDFQGREFGKLGGRGGQMRGDTWLRDSVSNSVPYFYTTTVLQYNTV